MCWRDVPEYVLLHVLRMLEHADVLAVGLVCRRWSLISKDSLIWKNLLVKELKLEPAAVLPPGSEGWFHEFERLVSDMPVINSQCIKAHDKRIFHVSFANNGTMFATTSMDSVIKVWNSDHPCTLKYEYNMNTDSKWHYPLYSQFNSTDSMLVVSGSASSPEEVYGEIVVFTLKNDILLRYRAVGEPPLEVYVQWIGEKHLISGKYIGTKDSIGAACLWINKINQLHPQDKRVAITSHPCKFHNSRESTVKLLLLGECKWNDEEENANDVIRMAKEPCSEDRIMVIYENDCLSPRAMYKSEEINQWKHDNDIRNKLIIFAIQGRGRIKHKIGLKKIGKVKLYQSSSTKFNKRKGNRLIWKDVQSERDMFDVPDKIINMQGNILGMTLSPDNECLYVNCCTSSMYPNNIIESDINIHVIDLVKLTFVRMIIHPPSINKYLFPIEILNDPNKYVVSRHDKCSAFIWNPHFKVCLAQLYHDDYINTMAFNPTDAHMCVSVGYGGFVKVWRSQSSTKKIEIVA